MIVTSSEPVHIGADGEEVTLSVASGSAVQLRYARSTAGSPVLSVAVGSSATLRRSCWAVAVGANAEVRLDSTVAPAAIDPRTPTVVNPAGLRRWREALAEAADVGAHVYCVGDSHTQGSWYDGAVTQTADDTARVKSYAARLRALFAAVHGDPGEGFIFADDPRVVGTGGIGGVGSSGPSVLRHARRFTAAGHTVTFTVPAGVTRVSFICGNRGTETGTVNATKNGVATTAVTSSGNDVPSATVYTVQAGDVLVWTGLAASALVMLGLTLRTSQKGVTVDRIGQGGYALPSMGGGIFNGALWFNNGAQQTLAQAMIQVQAIYKWRTAKGVVVIMFGTNDQTNQLNATGINCGSTPAIFQTALTAIVQQIAADGLCSLIVSPCKSGSETTAAGAEPLSSYAAVGRATAQANDHVAFIDLQETWGTDAAAAATAGLRDPGSSHPTPKGHGDIAQNLYNVLTRVPQGV